MSAVAYLAERVLKSDLPDTVNIPEIFDKSLRAPATIRHKIVSGAVVL